MVIVKDKTIMVSKGDTFLTLFMLADDGYKLDGSESIKFSVKKQPDEISVFLSLICGIDTYNNIISVYGSKEKMSFLPAGNYFYDIVMNLKSGARHTLVYPSRFIVREVCHE